MDLQSTQIEDAQPLDDVQGSPSKRHRTTDLADPDAMMTQLLAEHERSAITPSQIMEMMRQTLLTTVPDMLQQTLQQYDAKVARTDQRVELLEQRMEAQQHQLTELLGEVRAQKAASSVPPPETKPGDAWAAWRPGGPATGSASLVLAPFPSSHSAQNDARPNVLLIYGFNDFEKNAVALKHAKEFLLALGVPQTETQDLRAPYTRTNRVEVHCSTGLAAQHTMHLWRTHKDMHKQQHGGVDPLFQGLPLTISPEKPRYIRVRNAKIYEAVRFLTEALGGSIEPVFGRRLILGGPSGNQVLAKLDGDNVVYDIPTIQKLYGVEKTQILQDMLQANRTWL